MTDQYKGMSLRDEQILKSAAAGKTTRAIAVEMGMTEDEVKKKVSELLNAEVNTDIEFKRKLQVFRLEQIVNALWERVMDIADRDDVKNIILVLEKMDSLLALNKENDIKMQKQIQDFQAQVYLSSLQALIYSFKEIAPNAMSDLEWNNWTVEQLLNAQQTMTSANAQLVIEQ